MILFWALLLRHVLFGEGGRRVFVLPNGGGNLLSHQPIGALFTAVMAVGNVLVDPVTIWWLDMFTSPTRTANRSHTIDRQPPTNYTQACHPARVPVWPGRLPSGCCVYWTVLGPSPG